MTAVTAGTDGCASAGVVTSLIPLLPFALAMAAAAAAGVVAGAVVEVGEVWKASRDVLASSHTRDESIV